MKKKATLYLLIVIVAFIWGFIGYKIYKAVNKSDNMVKNDIPFISKKKSEEKGERYRLKANYTDPFTKKRVVRSSTVIKNKKTAGQKKLVKTTSSFPSVRYKGIVKPNAGKNTTFLLIINKKAYILKQGEEAEGVKILMGSKEKIKLHFEGETKEFSIQ